METILKRACVEHRLIGIGVNVFGLPDRSFIGVYVHWQSGDDRSCASGNGETFDEAFACALADMADRRAWEPA